MSFPRYGPAAGISAAGTIATTMSIAFNVVKSTCTEDDSVGDVSWLYGPGVWSAWVLTAMVVLVTNECDLSSKLVLSSSSIMTRSNNPVADKLKDKEVGESDDAWDGDCQASRPPGVDLAVTFVTGYSILTAMLLIYQLSLGKRTAEFEASFAITHASAIIITTLNGFSNHRTTWFRRLLWFLMGYFTFTTCYNSILALNVASESTYGVVGFYFRFFSQFFLLLCIPWPLDPQRRTQIKLDGWLGMLLLLAGFSYILTPIAFVLYWIVTSDGFMKYEKTPCTTFRLTSIVPQTGSSLTDPEQAVALCVALLNASRSLYRWWYSYQ